MIQISAGTMYLLFPALKQYPRPYILKCCPQATAAHNMPENGPQKIQVVQNLNKKKVG